LFSMPWSLVAPPAHPLLRRRRLELTALAAEPLILFERGSTGRQHVVEAFRRAGISPRVEMETTSTQISVRMVEAGLGLAIVPLLANGIVTRGCRVGVRNLGELIRPIDSGILLRRGETLSPAAGAFVEFVERRCREMNLLEVSVSRSRQKRAVSARLTPGPAVDTMTTAGVDAE
jgi:DNA-binding transcriptional LysR family regulator